MRFCLFNPCYSEGEILLSSHHVQVGRPRCERGKEPDFCCRGVCLRFLILRIFFVMFIALTSSISGNSPESTEPAPVQCGVRVLSIYLCNNMYQNGVFRTRSSGLFSDSMEIAFDVISLFSDNVSYRACPWRHSSGLWFANLVSTHLLWSPTFRQMLCSEEHLASSLF